MVAGGVSSCCGTRPTGPVQVLGIDETRRGRPARGARPRRFARMWNTLIELGKPGELERLATTIERWWPATEAFIKTRITNAKSEGPGQSRQTQRRSAPRVDQDPAQTDSVSPRPDRRVPRRT